jgi:Rad52/22 family double-strand break repair protein
MALAPAPDGPSNPHSPGTVAWVTECKRRLADAFPVALIEEKNGLAYLPHEVIRQRLIQATGNCFDWTIDQILFRDDGVTRRAKDRTTGEAPRPLSMVVVGRLAIPELGTRAGIGAHPLDAGSGEDAAYKSAESDALKRAAMAFGVGLAQLYLETGETKRSQPQRPRTPRRSSAPPPPPNWQAAWQARIDAALADSNGTGKQAWQQLVAEAIAARSEERLALLVRRARSQDAAQAILRRAEQHGLAGPLLADTQ